MNMLQSYYTSILKANLTLYEVRILVKIVERVQSCLHAEAARNYVGEKICTDKINYNFALQIRELLSDGSHHYEDVRQAVSSLSDKDITWYSSDRKQWKKAPVIYNVRWDEGSGVVLFSAAAWIIETILDFTAGFSKYDLATAMSLKTSNAVRMYMLTCSMTRPISYSVEFLKEVLGVPGMYTQTRDFIKRCIEPAAKELEEANVNGFSFSPEYDGRKVAKILLRPVTRAKKSRQELTAMAGLSTWCPPAMKNYLMMSCGFTSRELSANKTTLFEFSKLQGWQDVLLMIIERQRRKRKSKGYIIAAMKLEIKEQKAK